MVRTRKRFGQNFLIDEGVIDRIVSVVELSDSDRVLEIGPGTGSLTNELLKDNYRIKAIEVDNELTNILGERFGEVPNIEIINEDAMDYDYSQLTGPWWIMVGNLPYNIGTRLLVKLITEVPQIHRYVVMLQDEVAERIVAKPDTKQYGSLSVLASLFTNSKVQFNVSKNCFEPKPKILSTVVTIQRETLIDEDIRMKAFEISKVAFQQKRKKIKTALKDYIDEESSKKLSLDLNLRPQELTPENYLAIAEINS